MENNPQTVYFSLTIREKFVGPERFRYEDVLLYILITIVLVKMFNSTSFNVLLYIIVFILDAHRDYPQIMPTQEVKAD